MDPVHVSFYVLATLIAAFSLMVVLSRNAVTSAIFLVGDLFALAGMYATMEAHFIAAIQILIYAGAIVVLFVFVIMLLNLAPDARDSLRVPAPDLFMLLATLVSFGGVAAALAAGSPPDPTSDQSAAAIEAAGGNTYVVGLTLFTKYLWPFELASILILLAIVAAIVIAKRERPKGEPKISFAEPGRVAP